MSRSYLSGRVAWDGHGHRLPLCHRWFCEREYGPGVDGDDSGDDRNVRAQKLLPRNDDDGVDGGPGGQHDDPWNSTSSDLPEAGRNTLPAGHPVQARTYVLELDVDSGLHLRKGWGTDKGTVAPALVPDDNPRTR